MKTKTFDDALRAAFEAGYAAADNGRDPDFEEWRATYAGLDDEGDPVRHGDFVEHDGATWRVLHVDGDELTLHHRDRRTRRTHRNYVKKVES